MTEERESPLRAEHFRRQDESDDALFYALPRFVTHIDDEAIAAVTELYRKVLPEGGAILDLMSSWVSHLPDEVEYARVAGLGMNFAELAENPRLTDRVVQDLNVATQLPWKDGEFDGAVVTVSVQYLVRPVEVFRELARVLKARAPLVITYSNRMFPTKAISAWQALSLRERADLLGLYLRLAGGFDSPRAFDLSPNPGRTDPLYAVIAYRAATPSPA